MQEANPKKKTGCLGCFGVILLIAIAITGWSMWEDHRGYPATVLAWVYLDNTLAEYEGLLEACTGAGELSFLERDTPVIFTAGGAQDLHTSLWDGSGLYRDGYCAFDFNGKVRDKDEYTITIGEGATALATLLQ